MKPLQLSLNEARFLALRCQGLTSRFPFGRSRNAVVKMLEHLGYVQIDTISVVQRAHHHVGYSRFPMYSPEILNSYLNKPDGVFEYWAHAAAYLPMKDYRYSLPRKQNLQLGANLWFERDDKMLKAVYDRVAAEGPLCAADFQSKGKSKENGWWNWKPAKKALEQLFLEGRLMILERRGFQKVYDLTERVLPAGVDCSIPTEEEWCTHLIESVLKAHGLATVAQICYLRSGIRSLVSSLLEKMTEEGIVSKLQIEGVEQNYFMLHETSQLLGNIRYSDHVKILSPFDNSVIQRERLRTIFDFEYLFECYVPAEKRVYGYFSLPLLHKDRFIGMMDCKAHRKEKLLEIRSCHLQENKPTDLQEKLKQSLHEFAKFNDCEEIVWA